MKRFIFYSFTLLFYSATNTYFEREKAALYAHQNQWEAAHEQHLALLSSGNLDTDLLYDTGVCSYKVGDFEHAVSYFDHVTQAESASDQLRHDAHYNCGNAHALLSNFKQASREYEQALLYDPDDQDAKDNLEIVKKMQENQDNQGDSGSSGGDSSDQNNQNDGQSDQQPDQSDQNDQSNDQSQSDTDQGQDDQQQDNQGDADNDQKEDQQEQNESDQQDESDDSSPDNNQQDQDLESDLTQDEQQDREAPNDRDKQGGSEQAREGEQQEGGQEQRDDSADTGGTSENEQGSSAAETDRGDTLDDDQQGFFGQKDEDTPEWIVDLLSQQDEEDALMNRELALRQMQSGANYDTHNNW